MYNQTNELGSGLTTVFNGNDSFNFRGYFLIRVTENGSNITDGTSWPSIEREIKL